jgi:hypothetical protein
MVVKHGLLYSENNINWDKGGEENIWCMREEVTEGWTELQNEELHNLCSATNIIRVIKSRIRWAGHVDF